MKSKFRLLNNNRGAGLVTVIIAVSFLTALGLLIMALSYTSSEMKSSERIGNEVAFNAEGIVDEIRCGIELSISDSIKECYVSTMTNYSRYKEEIETIFDANLKKQLLEWKVYYNDENDEGVVVPHYYTSDGNATTDKTAVNTLKLFPTENTYSVAALSKMVTAYFGRDAKVTYAGKDTINGTLSWDSSKNKYVYSLPSGAAGIVGEAVWSDSDGDGQDDTVTLRNVKVVYKRLLRSFTITTDIVAKLPDLGFIVEESAPSSNFTEFSVIVKNKFEQLNGNVLVNGKAYAGELDLSEVTNSKFTVVSGNTLISKGDITVSGSQPSLTTEQQNDVNSLTSDIYDDEELLREKKQAKELYYKSRFLVDNNSTLWANQINVKQNSIVALCYKAFIANDLDLQSHGSSALIEGTYYGFGSDERDSSKSSAILVNGSYFNSNEGLLTGATELKKPVLNMVNAGGITLAGYAFINNGSVKTGDSTATRRDNKAYVAPLKLVDYQGFKDTNGVPIPSVETNPQLFSNATEYENFVNSLPKLTSADGYGAGKIRPANLNYVFWTKDGNSMTPADYGISILPISENYAGHTIGYFFMEFNDASGRTAIENSNLYFHDYFTYKPDQIQNYVAEHVDFSMLSNGAVPKSVGNFIRLNRIPRGLEKPEYKVGLKDSGSSIENIINIESIRAEVTKNVRRFTDYCITLKTRSNINSEVTSQQEILDEQLAAGAISNAEYNTRMNADNPFDFYVKVAEVRKALSKAKTHTIAFTSGENLVALITDQSFVYDNAAISIDGVSYSKDNLCLIISLADVEVKRDYTGLIMAMGNIKTSGSTVELTSSSEAVSKAATAASVLTREDLEMDERDDGITYAMPYEFVYFEGEFKAGSDYIDSGEGTPWDLDGLVTYNHWKKNS